MLTTANLYVAMPAYLALVGMNGNRKTVVPAE